MYDLPASIPITFIATTFLTVHLWYRSTGYSRVALIILLLWIILQGLIGYSGFYTNTEGVPPRFMLLVLPPVLTIIGLFLTEKGRAWLDGLDAGGLTLLHIVRIPVELVLFGLFLHHTIPQAMTFEGRNFDILAGLTAPVIFYAGFVRERMGPRWLLAWNIVCLGLLLNIIGTAFLSVPFQFQQIGFEQPNIAVLYFPFNWLPAVVVQLVLLSHLAMIRRLIVRPAAII